MENSKSLIGLDTERMSGFGNYNVDGMDVNLLYGLDQLCLDLVRPDMSVLELGTNDGISTMVFAGYAANVATTDIIHSRIAEKRFVFSGKNITYYSRVWFEDIILHLKKTGRVFDLVYIDGGHTYAEVVQDIQLASQVLKSGGILSGHDYNRITDGVIRAVSHMLLKPFEDDPSAVRVYPDSSWAVTIDERKLNYLQNSRL